ncbi:MAG: pectate lyase [Ignavibacteriales bacterium]|nr:pectate lyase [Ignavibacteriales bacterium]
MQIQKLSTLLLMLVCSTLIIAQNKISEKENAIPITGFYDSSHHWYDINEDDRVISPMPGQQRYNPSEIRKIADNILLYQKTNGGWPKNYDMLTILTDEQRDAVLKSKGELNTTFDNGTTHSQIDYLAKAFSITNDEKYKESCILGIEFILSAQYPNGGWPQFYPDTSGYRKYITFNDGAMIGIMELLKKFTEDAPQFSFLNNDLREKVKNAFDKGLDCILKCQIKEGDKLYVWCQQHDNVTLLPQNARTFEPASICNGESSGIVLLLMSINNPDEKIINSIQSAVEWFKDSKIFGFRVKEIPAPRVEYKYRTTSSDKVIEKDPLAPPIWARYYELRIHRPLFCNRDGKPVYSLAEVDRERRIGYGWYIYSPQDVLNKYSEWQKKWALAKNVLE